MAVRCVELEDQIDHNVHRGNGRDRASQFQVARTIVTTVSVSLSVCLALVLKFGVEPRTHRACGA